MSKKKTKNRIDLGLQARNELAAIDSLKPHPRNYRLHPDDQVAHLIESLKRFGVYRNVVVACDGTILAGHGVVQAAAKMKLEKIPVVRLDLSPDDPAAIKLLVGDNELEHLAEQDDRKLAELLKYVKDGDERGLLGTGYDEAMLANFLMVTRSASEVADFDAAAEWVGMPEYDSGPQAIKLIVLFATAEDVEQFERKLGITIPRKKGLLTPTTWYPPREREDLASLKFEG